MALKWLADPNLAHPPPSANPLSGEVALTLPCSSPTDLWRRPHPPPSSHVFSANAPTLYSPVPLNSFKSARITICNVRGAFKELYDQGGIVLFFPPSGAKPHPSPSESAALEQEIAKNWRWVKAGVEYYGEGPRIGTVATDAWSDWSIVDVPAGADRVSIEIRRAGNGDSGAWVYYRVADDQKWVPMREVTWAFHQDVKKAEDEVWVGVYAAKPTVGELGGKIEVQFEGFAVETYDDAAA